MSGLRLVLVTRRFWPLVGGAESVMANLAESFQAQGAQVTLATARWHRHWPARIVHRGVEVVRLPNPALRIWGTLRYMQALSAWLRRQANQFDLIYVSMLKHDAYAALGAAARIAPRPPVVLRAEGAGPSGDCRWQLDARGGRRIKQRCYQAQALIGPSLAIQRELIAAGYQRERIHYLPNGVPTPPPADARRRAEARASLARSHPALRLPPAARVVLFIGRLHRDKGLLELVAAFVELADRQPPVWLWLAGEGPLEPALARQTGDLGLAGRVVLAGVFDDVAELLAAADVFVLPSHEEGLSVALLEAMAAGLPCVASDIPGNRQLIADGVHGRLVPPGDPQALARGLAEALRQPGPAPGWGEAARARVAADYSLAACAARHLALFTQLVACARAESD